MTMMTIAICDDMQADARKLHKQLERIVPGSEIRIFKSGELLLEELEKKRKPYDAIFVNIDSKVCDALNCSIDYILGRSVINTIDKKSLPPRVFNLLVEIAYFESRIADYNKSHKTDCISVLTPTGYVQDGMVFDSISTNIVNISAYKKDFGDIVLCGIKIVGRNLSPFPHAKENIKPEFNIVYHFES